MVQIITWTTNTPALSEKGVADMCNQYTYDQLNRIKSSTISNKGNAYKTGYSYDANGNLLSLQRYNGTGQKFDAFKYNYEDKKSGYLANTNKLRSVDDTITDQALFAEDLEDQDVDNYAYDDIGNLNRDTQEEIDKIEWTVYGKVRAVYRISGSNKPNLVFEYDASGNRVTKTSIKGTDIQKTYYIRDANGNVMSTYTSTGTSSLIALQEQYLYGSSRLGVLEKGSRSYELTDHLGNVRAVVGEFKEVKAAYEYYAFGMSLAKVDNGYRYGFNGKEKDGEISDSWQDYGFREYDRNLARFISVDPLTTKYPELSTYQFASNCPISGIDLDGLEYYYAANGKLIGRIGQSTEVRLVDESNIEKVTKHIINNNISMSGNSLLALTKHRIGTVSEQDYINGQNSKSEADKFSSSFSINNDQLVAFASVIHAESGGGKEESYAIGNVTMNFIEEGGSSELKTLDDVTMYDNTFAQGATQKGYTDFKGMTAEEQNSKFALGAAINAIGFTEGLKGFIDVSGGADSWDGIDLISSKYTNGHRDYSWSEDSKDLLLTYKNSNNGGIDVSKWTYKKTGFQIETTKIVGKTLFTNLQGGRGEKKQSSEIFK